MDDAEVLLRWRNDEQTRRWSRRHEPVGRAEHLRWLRRALVDPRCLLWVGQDAALPAGVVRYDLDVDREQGEISITVAPEQRGQGVAGRLLRRSEPALRAAVPTVETAVARIHAAHYGSLRLFEGAGYRRDDQGEDAHGFLRLCRRIPSGPLRTAASAVP